MAQKRTALPFKEIALKIVGPRDSFLASRVQRFDVNTNFPSTDIDEIGDIYHAGVTTGTPEVTATFNAMDVSIKIFAALTGTDPANYPAEGVSINNLKEIDVIGLVKDPVLARYVKTIHGKKLRIASFKYTYTVNGEGTEEYTANGSERRWFKNDVIIDRITTGTNSFTLSTTPTQLKNGNKLLSVILDGVYLTEVAATPATGEYSVSGTTLSTGDSRTNQVIAVYHVDTTADSTWVNVSDATIPAAVKGKNIPISIAANNIYRVQSIDISGTMPTTKVEEHGNLDVVGYMTQIPQITGNISVLDTDIELITLLTAGSIQAGDTELPASQLTASGLSLRIKIQNVTNTAVLKTLYLPAITITSEGYTSSVGNNVTQTYAFKSTTGDLLIFSGSY